MKIIEYNDYDDIVVIFLEKGNCRVKTQYTNFLKGVVKNYNQARHGFNGFIGKGDYQSEYKINGKRVEDKAYKIWSAMHRRAGNFDGKHPAYEDVTIAEEWWNFQNFARWYYKNLYNVILDGKEEIMCVDKDLLYPGNREYGPDKCLIVPNRINELIKRGDKKTAEGGTELPTGVTIRKRWI